MPAVCDRHNDKLAKSAESISWAANKTLEKQVVAQYFQKISGIFPYPAAIFNSRTKSLRERISCDLYRRRRNSSAGACLRDVPGMSPVRAVTGRG
jgi:hypothetical protein